MSSPTLNFAFDATKAIVSARANSAGLVYTSNGDLTLVSGLAVTDGLGFGEFGNNSYVNGPLRAANGGLIPKTLTTAVYQNLHLVAGQTLKIDTQFIPGENHYRDEAVLLLKDDATGSIVAAKIADVQTVIDNNGATRYTTTFTIPSTSTYNLLVGVADIGDSKHPSTLKVERLSVDVPGGQYSLELGGVRLADGSLLKSDGSVVVGNSIQPSVLANSSAGFVAGLELLLASHKITSLGDGLISKNGSSLISQDGASLLSQQGGGVSSSNAGSSTSNVDSLVGSIADALRALIQQTNSLQSRAFGTLAASGQTGHNYGVMSLDGDTDPVPSSGGSTTFSAPVPGLEVDVGGATKLRYDERSAVADLGNGRYVVAFAEYNVLSNGSRAYSIRAQIVNADGSLSGPELTVNNPSDSDRGTASELADPSVAAIGGGGFIVAWVNGQHPRPPGLTTGSDLFAQRFNADGSPQGPGFQLNTTVSNTQYNTVKVTALTDGGYVAIWSEKPGYTSADLFTLHGKVFNADGTQRGSDFSLSGSSFFANVYSPTVTATSGGGFIAAFQGNAPNPQTVGVITGIGVQAYDANGVPKTRNPTLVLASDTDSLTKPNLVTLSTGDVAVTWVDTTQHAVYSLVLNASLVAKETAPIYVGGSYSDFYGPPAIAALSDGRFVVGWTDSSNGNSAQAQILTADNTLYGPQFPVFAPGGGDATTAPALIQLSTGTLIASSTHQFYSLPADDVRALPIAIAATGASSAPAAKALIIGAAVHGYVSGGTVFADANGNGTLDAGEVSATTTADGLFALAPSATGSLVLTGGTDVATGRPFTGRYTAPAGSQTVDALTTLVQRIMASGVDIGTAQMKVATAFGLSADAALTQVDPMVASQSSDTGRAILLANAILADVTDLAIAAGSADPLGVFASQIAAQAAFTSFDPSSTFALGAAGLTGQTLTDTSAIAAAVKASLLAKGAADAGNPAKLVADVNRVEVIVQTGAVPALSAAIASGTTAAVASAYTGASLDAKLNGTDTPTITRATIGVYRFFDSKLGTHFFTNSTSERDSIAATRADLINEGVGLQAVDPASNDPNATAVYRFFDTKFGTHFFTADATERDQVIAGRPDLAFEGTGFYEHMTQQAGDVAVYRFFDKNFGTHFYTSDAGERAGIVATRADLVDEGIGFYAPKG